MAVALSDGASKLNLFIAGIYATNRDRYSFQRELGEGAFGKVFLAEDRCRQRVNVAIKLIAIRARHCLAPNRLDDALREAELMWKLSHEHIIGYIDSFIFQADTLIGVGIVMPFCSRGNLGNYLLSNGKPTRQTRLQWSSQLAKGMQFLHSQGVAHRDLKPDNILIDGRGSLKIADIGLAKVWAIQVSVQTTLNQYLTSVKGTKIYIAPEVYTAHYTGACDVFSLGLVFIAIIEVPVCQITVHGKQETFIAPLAKWGRDRYPYGGLLHEDRLARGYMASALLSLESASPGERQLIEWMLKFHPNSRPSMAQVVTNLQSLEDSQYLPIVAVYTPRPSTGCCS